MTINTNDRTQSRWLTFTGVLTLVICGLAPLTGCGKSDAARMEEFRKYAGAGAAKDDDEDDEPVVENSTPFTPPSRGDRTSETAAATPTQPAATDTAAKSADAAPAATATPDKPAPPAAVDGVTDTKAPPATQLTDVERRQVTIDNMTKIANALEAYRSARGGGAYPAQYVGDSNGRPLLSWRVALLPMLGYEKLYKQFKLNQAWDSNHNRKLIEKIPSVYQSPERFDFYTNYLAASGSAAAFNGHKPKPIRRWEDGLENAILLVEVNDDKSVIWTQPEDLKFDPLNPATGLGGLRADGFFAVWGGGDLTVVPNGGGSLKNAFTVDGGDITASTLKKPAFAQAGGLQNAFRRNTTTAGPASATPANSATTSISTNGAATQARTGNTAQPVSAGPLATANADAQEAFTQGREADAIQLYYANVAASDRADSWLYQYQWIPGLSRPCAIIRYGIGIEFTGPNAMKAKATALRAIAQSIEAANTTTGRPNRFGARSQGVSKAYGQLAGTFGNQILQVVKSRPLHAPFVAEAPQQPTRRVFRRSDDDEDDYLANQLQEKGARLAPGIQFIGVDRARVLTAAARKHEVDALILFEIDEKASNRGSVREVSVSVVDVVRKKTIYKSKKLNSRAVQQAKLDLIQDDPTPSVIRDFRDFIEAKLTPGPMPPQLRPAVAEKRVAWLGNQNEKNPLRTLAEIQLYRNLDLIKVTDQMDAYKNLLGSDAAITLIGGSPAEKAELLEDFLPLSPIAGTN